MTARTKANRTALLLLAGALACAALTGCSQTASGASTAHPKPGTCHDLRYAAEINAASDASPAVDCRRPHTVETFATGTVTGDYASWHTRPNPTVLASLTGSICGVPDLRAYLGATERDSASGMSIHAYYPSESAWRNGARSVACDVSINGHGGAPLVTTHSIQAVMKTPRSARLRICYRQNPLPHGAWSIRGHQIACDKPHSSQDISAWLALDSPTITPQAIAAKCLPYVQDAAGTKHLPKSLRSTGVIVQRVNNTWALHCAIGGDSNHGTFRGAYIPAADH